MATVVSAVSDPTARPARVVRHLDPLLRPSYGVTLISGLLLAKLLWFDHQIAGDTVLSRGTLANVGTVLVLVSWLALVRPTRRLLLSLILDLVVSTLVFADLLYLRFFDGFITAPVLLQAEQAGAVESSIAALAEPTDALLFADLPALLAAWWLFRQLARVAQPPGPPTRVSDGAGRQHRVAVALVFFVSGLVLLGLQSSLLRHAEVRSMLEKQLADIPVYRVTGLLGFHAYDTFQFVSDRVLTHELSPHQLEQIEARFHPARERTVRMPDGAPAFGQYRDNNVLVVQVESLQSFVIGRELAGQEITPNINRLVGHSAYFANSFHQTADGRTSDAELLTGCSLYPAASGAAFVRFSANQYDCLPGILDRRGYSTAASHAFSGSFWNRDHMYPSMGYEHFYTRDDHATGERLGWGLGDRPFLSQTVRRLQSGSQPFYHMAVTLTSHHPYDLPELPTEMDVGALEGTTLGDYVDTMHYVDSAIGSMVNELERSGLWEDTVVVLYGDHDNGIEDWDSYERLLGRSLGEYERARMHSAVPLLIHFPDNAHSGVFNDPVGQIDVAPTLLHLLGVSQGDRYVLGHNVFSTGSHRVVFPDGGFVDHGFLFMPSEDGLAGGGRCYEHGTGQLVNSQLCQDGAEAAEADLRVSELVLTTDALRELSRHPRTERPG